MLFQEDELLQATLVSAQDPIQCLSMLKEHIVNKGMHYPHGNNPFLCHMRYKGI